MKSRCFIVMAPLIAALLLSATGCAGGGAAASSNPTKPAAVPAPGEMKLPPGWTEDDMKACMVAGTPGKMHEHLLGGVGKWQGKNTMWMFPGADPVVTDTTSTVTSVMDGRYVRIEYAGEMPGMGPYSGSGLAGFDNVTQQFVTTWIDNHSTGIMVGTGELSADGKIMTWKYAYNCPVTKKPTVMREVETITGPNTKTLEFFGVEPKSGQEFKMMFIQLTRK